MGERRDWLTPHPGGWAKGIEVYRDYVEQVNPPRPLPKHIQNGLGFQTIWMTQQPEKEREKVYFRYTDIPRVARDALQYGLTELVPWFWNSVYFTMPIRSSRLLGTEQELLQGIAQAKALGVTWRRSSVFTSSSMTPWRDMALSRDTTTGLIIPS